MTSKELINMKNKQLEQKDKEILELKNENEYLKQELKLTRTSLSWYSN